MRGGVIPYGNIPKRFVPSQSNLKSAFVTNIGVTPQASNPDLTNLWRMDMLGINKEIITYDEQSAIDNYESTVTYKDSQYWSGLPWRPNYDELPSNYKLVEARLALSLKKLSSRPDHNDNYDSVVKDQVEKGFIEKVHGRGLNKKCHYIPHLPVVRDSETTPLLHGGL